MKVKNYLWTLAAALALVGCSDDLETQKGGPEENGNGALGETYVAFTIAQPETKANPSGGEDGDGFEAGNDAENAVHSLTLYFIGQDATGTFTGINADGDTPIYGPFRIGQESIKSSMDASYYTDPVLLPAAIEDQIEFDKVYGVLALANVDADNLPGNSTLGELRKSAIQVGVFGDEQEGDFLMSSETTGQIIFRKINNSKENPATARILVERMAARIDFMSNTVDQDYGDNVYPIYKKELDGKLTNEVIAKVELQTLKVVNQWHNLTHFFKTVTEGGDIKGPMIWLGLEKAGADKIQTNYVVDPSTRNKTDDLQLLSVLKPYYYNHISEVVNVASFYDKAGKEGIKEFTLARSGVRPAKDGYEIVGYTEENTTDKEAQLNGYSTGVIFKGVATILKAYTRAEVQEVPNYPGEYYYPSIDFADAQDQDFYIYEDMPYLNLETIVQRSVTKASADGSVSTGWAFDHESEQNALAAAKTVKDLEDYIGAFADYDCNLGYRAYMEKLVKDNNLTATSTEAEVAEVAQKMLWSVYKNVITESTFDLSKYSVRASKNHTVDCYYPYWIKHSDNENPREMGIMEFGIVRNNIYKLKVTSINNFGIFQLDPTAPDEPDELWMKVELQVKDWVLRYNDNIEL
ncbi:Mfa1 family fimbria major subunit [Parabacteroides johnsonii]|jgi:hypothetical protein|uniref:Mfa1 family fimbria major subunit n=1 Tax=Parabacteroides johnsonii TaxID=387661 RepID=UPI001C3951F1|nr:Mfa1 family fimbria major subunit [Parabacteroides johnsonii]MBV4242362.1 Mfa1 fimbrilin C-terminal domain-containing protein [Parabacteroides johnsonii]